MAELRIPTAMREAADEERWGRHLANKTIRAPFTPEQVAALNTYQANGRTHPYTCANRGDGRHRTTTDLGVLVATAAGWVCRDCDYTQDWAHALSMEAGNG
jgi:hypothetical protein